MSADARRPGTVSASRAPAVPLHGLVLAGGRSRRMGEDKALLAYHGRTQLEHTVALVAALCEQTFVSVRADQRDEPVRSRFAQLVDLDGVEGPAAGIRAAQRHAPGAAWLVVACDLPFLDEATLAQLVAARDVDAAATAYISTHDGLPEPLCAIWEPASGATLAALIAEGRNCPRKALLRMNTTLIEQAEAHRLDNANTQEDRERVLAAGRGDGPAAGRPSPRRTGEQA